METAENYVQNSGGTQTIDDRDLDMAKIEKGDGSLAAVYHTRR